MSPINTAALRNLDLNLLVHLCALLEERHVSRAAERVGISQPAMSAALARLRAIFDDQLLVKGPGGLILTLRGEQLETEVKAILSSIERLTSQQNRFDPGVSHRTFLLVGTDFIESLVLPELIRCLAEEAPNVMVLFQDPSPKNHVALMSSGEVELAVGYLPDPPPGLMTSKLFTDDFVCILRRDHPAAASALSVDTFVQLSHVQVLPRDAAVYATPVDERLSACGHVRRIVLWQPTFLATAHIVSRTDLISTVPRRLAEMMEKVVPIALLEPPLDFGTLDFCMFWHPRNQNDPGHSWLRKRIAALVREIVA